MATCLTAMNKGAGWWRVSVYVKCDLCCVSWCEGFDGSLRGPCDNDSLMRVPQRDEADSLDSTVCGTGGSDLELAPPEQQSDRWSVFSVYEGGECKRF